MKNLWALPGFLGLPTDWDFLIPTFPHLKSVELHHLTWKKLKDWGKCFNEWVTLQDAHPGILMGYSLGGRLALHALIEQPHLWEAAIIISAHPGLPEESQRCERLQSDSAWAYRLECEEWESLMRAWNSQEVFASDPGGPKRKECDYQREHLVDLMIKASLGQQDDLRTEISHLPMPILWVTGENDQRYCELAETVTLHHRFSQKVQLQEMGHRLPWQSPHQFIQTIEEFMRLIVTR